MPQIMGYYRGVMCGKCLKLETLLLPKVIFVKYHMPNAVMTPLHLNEKLNIHCQPKNPYACPAHSGR